MLPLPHMLANISAVVGGGGSCRAAKHPDCSSPDNQDFCGPWPDLHLGGSLRFWLAYLQHEWAFLRRWASSFMLPSDWLWSGRGRGIFSGLLSAPLI